jgi:glutathione S-transferase
MLKIYGNPMSTCTRVVLTTLAETNTPYEMQVIDFMTGEHKKEAHVARQPFGRIPTLDDDGFQMFESRAMARYINDKAKGKLVPADLKDHARMEQWISIETSEFSGNAMKFVYDQILKRPQEPAVLEAAKKGLETTCAVMDKQLAKTPYLAGAEFSLADITFMPYFDYAMMTSAKETLSKFPHVMTWWNRVSERPSWRKAAGRA